MRYIFFSLVQVCKCSVQYDIKNETVVLSLVDKIKLIKPLDKGKPVKQLAEKLIKTSTVLD